MEIKYSHEKLSWSVVQGSAGGQTKKDLRICETGGDKKGCSLLQISCSLETDLDEVLVVLVSVISTGHL